MLGVETASVDKQATEVLGEMRQVGHGELIVEWWRQRQQVVVGDLHTHLRRHPRVRPEDRDVLLPGYRPLSLTHVDEEVREQVQQRMDPPG